MAKRKDPGLLPELARPERYHHGDLRAALLEGALRLLQGGEHAFSLRTLARAVGVSPAAVYHHFRDVRELLAAVAEEGLRALAGRLEGALAATAEPPAPAVVRAYLGLARSGPARYATMFDPGLGERAVYPGLVAADAAVRAQLTEMVARLGRGGRERAGKQAESAHDGGPHERPDVAAGLAPERTGAADPLVQVVWGALHGAAMLELLYRAAAEGGAEERDAAVARGLVALVGAAAGGPAGGAAGAPAAT